MVISALEHENARLTAQVARLREAVEIGIAYMNNQMAEHDDYVLKKLEAALRESLKMRILKKIENGPKTHDV